MSYILDALRKSEQERRQIEVGGQVLAPDHNAGGRNAWLPWALATALVVNSALVGWLLLRNGAETSPAATVAAAEPVELAPQPEPPRTAPALADVVGKPQAMPTAAPTPAQPAPQPVKPPVAAASAPVAAAPALMALPLSAMPADFQRAIPDINVSVHVFAEQPASRWVLVNGRRAHEGQEIAAGLKLERITPDGMVLQFRGQRFAITVR